MRGANAMNHIQFPRLWNSAFCDLNYLGRNNIFSEPSRFEEGFPMGHIVSNGRLGLWTDPSTPNPLNLSEEVNESI